MRLSILDQAPVSDGQTAQEALFESMKLAQAGEVLGYTRYWIAEHHDLPGLACPAPEVMLGFIGAHTTNIRIGSGAVLLPHYKPYKVAEVYNLLATLFPERIDIGIGRAPGGSAEATNALSDNFLQAVWKMPEQVEQLLHFLYRDFPEGHEFSGLSASPVPHVPPHPWLLGTSIKSALLAAEHGLAYAFGQFMSEKDGSEIVQQYFDRFKPKRQGDNPQCLVTVSVICGETDEAAEEMALSTLVWSLKKEKGETGGVPGLKEAKQYQPDEKERLAMEMMKQKTIIGNPKKVVQKLKALQAMYKTDEIMIVTITHSTEDRLRSYELIASEAGLGSYT